jgi:hypothetical protein
VEYAMPNRSFSDHLSQQRRERLQANAKGDLSGRAKARTAELALDSEVRVEPIKVSIIKTAKHF